MLFLQGLDLRQGIQPVEGSKSCFDVSFGQRPGVDEAQGCGVDIVFKLWFATKPGLKGGFPG
ncbi:hypothetical protein, partial [Corynebacterium sp. HMSC078H07]|uniref:hypothetical protein n=1 Tax=Corynebacterium sp. HMSC078H07 TaxID=1739379 RepID=UPI001FF021C9